MIVLLFVFTAFSLLSFAALLVGSDPYSAGTLVRALFFTTLFLSMTGVFTLSGVWFSKTANRRAVFEVIFRRAILLASLVVSLILLETFSLLNIFNVSAASLFIVGLEILMTYRTNINKI